jgi:hypothetical protein
LSNQKEWRPRISVAIDEEKYYQLQQAIPWGMRDKIFRQFADELIRISTQYGPIALSLLATRGFDILLKEDKDGPGTTGL